MLRRRHARLAGCLTWDKADQLDPKVKLGNRHGEHPHDDAILRHSADQDAACARGSVGLAAEVRTSLGVGVAHFIENPPHAVHMTGYLHSQCECA